MITVAPTYEPPATTEALSVPTMQLHAVVQRRGVNLYREGDTLETMRLLRQNLKLPYPMLYIIATL